MILISHRGNILKRNPEMENRKEYIEYALYSGYNVEVDVWFINQIWYLGHDKPEYQTTYEFLSTPNLWLHCKNIEALEEIYKDQNIILNAFYHEKDPYTLTSYGYIWCYPGMPCTPGTNSIAVLPELIPGFDVSNFRGVCSDQIQLYDKSRTI